MDVNKILEARLAYPYRPFTLVLNDGRRLAVEKAYYLGISEDRVAMMCATDDGDFEVLKPGHVKDIEFDDFADQGQKIA